MKKHIVRVILFLIIFLSVPFLTSVFHETVSAAITKSVTTVRVSPTPTPTPAKVEYFLPYPGMLPDNPLYFLKNLRDKIIEFLISDPISKASFYILQADKKLNMGISLSSMGKSAETQKILAESLTARTQAVAELESAVQSGKQVPSFILEKLVLSLEKHKEVLTGMKLGTDAVSGLLTRAQQMVKSIK